MTRPRKAKIAFRSEPVVKVSVSIPVALYKRTAPLARDFKSYSAFVQRALANMVPAEEPKPALAA